MEVEQFSLSSAATALYYTNRLQFAWGCNNIMVWYGIRLYIWAIISGLSVEFRQGRIIHRKGDIIWEGRIPSTFRIVEERRTLGNFYMKQMRGFLRYDLIGCVYWGVQIADALFPTRCPNTVSSGLDLILWPIIGVPLYIFCI